MNYHNVAVRHGMTIGELAKLYNGERHINANLTVVPMKGWIRGDWFDSTGVEWVNPSPNLRNLEEAILYPGVALIEGHECLRRPRNRHAFPGGRCSLDKVPATLRVS